MKGREARREGLADAEGGAGAGVDGTGGLMTVETGGGADGVRAGGQGDGLAVGHLHTPAGGQGQCAALAALVALGWHGGAVVGAGKAELIDAGDGVIYGEARRPARDRLDLLLHLVGGSGLVVEARVEAVVLQIRGGDVSLCRSCERCSVEQERE